MAKHTHTHSSHHGWKICRSDYWPTSGMQGISVACIPNASRPLFHFDRMSGMCRVLAPPSMNIFRIITRNCSNVRHWRPIDEMYSMVFRKKYYLLYRHFLLVMNILELLKTARYLWYEGLRIRKIIFLIPSQEMDSYILERRGVVDYIDLKNKISTINSHLLFILLKIYPTYYSMKRSF